MPMKLNRFIYKTFFWVTGISYFIIAFFTYHTSTLDHLWPGKVPWTIGYLIVGLGAFCTGFFIKRSVKGPKLWLRRFGLYATPALLAARGISNLFANGIDGAVGAVFLFWAAFVVLWAAVLLRNLPASLDEWELLEDEFYELREQVSRLS